MTEDVEYLTLEDLVALATLLLGDPPPIRDIGLLGSAAARPATTVFGEDAYPDLWAKGAALLQSLVESHPLVDGNKRLGWLATAVFLELNGTSVCGVSNDDVYAFVMNAASGHHEVDDLARALRTLVTGGYPDAVTTRRPAGTFGSDRTEGVVTGRPRTGTDPRFQEVL